MKELGGKTGALVRLDLPLRVGEVKQGSDPHSGAIVWVRGETLKAEGQTADLWQPKWNKNQTVLATAIHPLQEHVSPGRHSGWKLEFRDCGATPGRGLLVTAERRMEGMWGRRTWWEMPVEESWAAIEARWYCWVTRRGWSNHHSLSLPTRQHPKLNSREAGPSNAWRTELQSRTPPRVPLSVTDVPIYGVGPQPGGPSMCLTHRTTEKDPRQGSPAWTGGATGKDWPKRLSDHQLQEARKKTLIGP